MKSTIVEALRPIARHLPRPVKAFLLRTYLQMQDKQSRARVAAAAASPVAPEAGKFAASMDVAPESPVEAVARAPRLAKRSLVDVVISPNEISFAHGTGVLLSRLLEDRKDIVAIRSRTNYGGHQRLAAREMFALPVGMTDRREIMAQVSEWLADYDVRSILCVPYFETDVTLAIVAQAITGAPLGLWIMDDNCLEAGGIRRAVMAEGIERASALFGISNELKRRYQVEFRKPMAVLPPLVAPSMVRTKPSPAPTEQRLVMIGNVWSADLLDRLSKVVETAGLKVDWYSSNPGLWTNQHPLSDLTKRGVNVIEGDDPDVVRKAVLSATAVVVPSDPGDSGEHEKALGTMSLPTRMPFVLATAGTPMIVLGREGTAAGGFVKRLDIGSVIPYDAQSLKTAVEALSKPEAQNAIRKRAAELASQFSFEGVDNFVFDTILAGGRWPDDRFENLFPTDPKSFAYFFDKPVAPQYAAHFGEVVSLCDRLKGMGFTPDFVLDIGASTAIWSNAVASVFDKARYILCDPMFQRYPNVWAKPGFELVEVAIGDKPGQATFSVSSDLYGSSLLSVSDVVSVVDKVEVQIKTIDAVAKEKKITGRGLLKIDVQFAEHLAIEGALKTLDRNVDVVILELTLTRVHPEAKTLLEMCNRMDELGFRVFDQVGGWRVPSSGELEQLDLAFVRKGLAGTIHSVDAKA